MPLELLPTLPRGPFQGRVSVQVGMDTTLSGQWAPAHRLRRKSSAHERGRGDLLGLAPHTRRLGGESENASGRPERSTRVNRHETQESDKNLRSPALDWPDNGRSNS